MTNETISDCMRDIYVSTIKHGVQAEVGDILAYNVIRDAANVLSTMEQRRLVDFIDHRMKTLSKKSLKKL